MSHAQPSSPSSRDLLTQWAEDAPAELVLGEREQQAFVDRLTRTILDAVAPASGLRALEAEARSRDDVPVAVELAIKLAVSKRCALDIDTPVHLSIVFAVYNEHHRLGPPSAHPHGEDALVRKIEQLDALVADCPSWSWDLTVVDDGCPNGSGGVAQQIIRDLGREDQVRVLFLEEAIAAGSPATKGLESAAQSRKGGSIHLGMWDAAATPRPGHVIVFTDADLSTHLGQCGRLASPIVNGDAVLSIGSRRRPLSVVLKGGARNDRGKLFIYLWKRMLGALDGVADTQCGFKAFDAGEVQPWIEAAIEPGFAFDIELLLQADRQRPGGIARVPVAWIDSEEASTTSDLQPYLPMLRAVAAIARHHRVAGPESESFIRFVESLDEAAWQRLVGRIPAAIAGPEPLELEAHGAVVSADELWQASRD